MRCNYPVCLLFQGSMYLYSLILLPHNAAQSSTIHCEGPALSNMIFNRAGRHTKNRDEEWLGVFRAGSRWLDNATPISAWALDISNVINDWVWEPNVKLQGLLVAIKVVGIVDCKEEVKRLQGKRGIEWVSNVRPSKMCIMWRWHEPSTVFTPRPVSPALRAWGMRSYLWKWRRRIQEDINIQFIIRREKPAVYSTAPQSVSETKGSVSGHQ